MVRVKFREGVGDVHGSLLTHEEVEVGEGELHVVRAAQLVGGRLGKLYGIPDGGGGENSAYKEGRVQPSTLNGEHVAK